MDGSGRKGAGSHSSRHDEERVTLSLSDAAEYLLEECRMVLPGLQALFGFQLIAVFSDRFARDLSPFEQRLHLVAIGLVAIAIALIMTPAAYHRQRGAQEIRESFVTLSTRLVLSSMVPLALAISIDFHLIARLILGGRRVWFAGAGLLAVFTVLWFALPASRVLRNAFGTRKSRA